MKLLKRMFIALLVACSVILVAPVVTPLFSDTYTVEAASVKLNKTKVTLNVGENYTLKVKGTSKKVKWSTSNKKVATVNSKGKVTAKKKGTVTITAKVGNKKYTCKVKVESPKINKTSKTIYVGSTYRLKVSGTSQKIKWSSSDTSVVEVNSKGKITGIKAGKATITAKVGSTKYKAKITVKGYEGNIKVSFKETNTSVIAFLTNKNSFAVSVSPKVVFYDENNNIQSTTSDFNYCLEPNATCVLTFESYNTSTYRSQTYAKYKFDFGEVTKSYYSTYGTDKISVTSNKTDGAVIAEVKNNSGKNLSTINLTCVFYDENGNVIDCSERYADCGKKGTTDYINFYYPYDESYNTITPASYKIYVNHAYAYNS